MACEAACINANTGGDIMDKDKVAQIALWLHQYEESHSIIVNGLRDESGPWSRGVIFGIKAALEAYGIATPEMRHEYK